jgi:hypothetical protein
LSQCLKGEMWKKQVETLTGYSDEIIPPVWTKVNGLLPLVYPQTFCFSPSFTCL